jgi:hypothetical protein
MRVSLHTPDEVSEGDVRWIAPSSDGWGQLVAFVVYSYRKWHAMDYVRASNVWPSEYDGAMELLYRGSFKEAP